MNRVLLSVGLATLAAVAAPQSYSSRQQGEYTENGRRTQIESARFDDNRRNFDLEIRLRDGRRISLSGSQTRIGDRYSLRLTDIRGERRANGTGFAVIRRDELQYVELNGASDSGRFALRFGNMNGGLPDRPDRPDWPNRPDWPDRPDQGRPASGETSGRGFFRIGRDDRSFRRVSFRFREDGRFSLTISGGDLRSRTYEGTWSGRGTRLNLEIQGRRGDRTDGRGSVRLSENREEIRSLEIDGRDDGDRFSLDFRDN